MHRACPHLIQAPAISVAILLLSWMPSGAQPAPPYDLLLKGGHVIDARNGINGPRDVAVAGRAIAAVAADIPAAQARQVVNVTGYYVTPGLVDLHTHLHHTLDNNGLKPEDRTLSSGVTTVVDVGSVGWRHFLTFKDAVVDRARIRVFVFLNSDGYGQVGERPRQTVEELQSDILINAGLIKKYPDIIRGLKSYRDSQRYEPMAQQSLPPWANLDAALEAGRLAGVPVMIDFWPRPPEHSYEELILRKLRPGDIHTHFLAQQFPVILDDGTVNPIMQRARDRGVLLDVGHGSGSFWWRNGIPAIRQGFYPSTISTDLHRNIPEISMTNVMSKFLAMGMPLEEVIRRSTMTPADAIRRPDLGSLSPGAPADIAVFEVLQGRFGYIDCGIMQGPDGSNWRGARGRSHFVGDRKMEARLTVFGGQIFYDPCGLALPDWADTPRPW